MTSRLADEARLNVLGVCLASLYVVCAPIMLQNSFEPAFSGYLGKMQIADLLAPLMLLWLLASWRWGGVMPRVASDRHFRWCILLALAYVAIGPLSSLANGASISVGDTLKRAYLVLSFLFFLRVFRIENASFIVMWVSVYTFLLFSGLSVLFYVAYLVTGESNLFVKIATSVVFDRQAGHLTGPMRPTENLFGTYLILLAGSLIIGVEHLKRAVWLVLLAAVLLAGLLTLSRPGALAAILVLLSLASMHRHRVIWLALLAIPSLLAVAILETSAIWDYFKFARLFEAGASVREAWLPTVARHLKLGAWELWKASPVLGAGPESFTEGWRILVERGSVPSALANLSPQTPESTYLHLMVESGLVGLGIWLGMLTMPLWGLRETLRAIPGRIAAATIWTACVAILMIDLNVTNFRFLYYMLPLVATLPARRLGIPPQSDL